MIKLFADLAFKCLPVNGGKIGQLLDGFFKIKPLLEALIMDEPHRARTIASGY